MQNVKTYRLFVHQIEYSYKLELIHEADHSPCSDHYCHTGCPSVRRPPFEALKIVIVSARTVELAEWIIDK